MRRSVHLAHVVEHGRRLDQVDVVVKVPRQTVRQGADDLLRSALVLVNVVRRGEHGLDFRQWKPDIDPVSRTIPRHV